MCLSFVIEVSFLFFSFFKEEINHSFLGAMDPSAYIDKEGWERILRECNLDQFDLRENRYNQV
jgi:hypothetical protein